MKKIVKALPLALGIVLVCAAPALASDVFDAAGRLVNDAADTIRLISTPAALIGVGSGAFMKKFSAGNQQKIEMGNKVFWGSIVGWGTINGLPLILGTVQKYIGG